MTLDNGNVRKNSESDRRDFFNQQQHLANNIRKKRFKFCQKQCRVFIQLIMEIPLLDPDSSIEKFFQLNLNKSEQASFPLFLYFI